MFDIYVSAQTADFKPTRGETVAAVMVAYAHAMRTTYSHYPDSVTFGIGTWHGESEDVAIISFSNEYHENEMVRLAELLRIRLGQESVLIVSDVEIDDWDACYKSERDLGDSYTVRDGMGQRPYAYMAGHRATHWARFVNA